MAKKTSDAAVEGSKTKSKVRVKPALDIALASINKKYGSVIKWLDEVPSDNIDFISSGSIALDYALGGGFPRGRVVEIFGWESCGKSTLAMSVAAQANKTGLNCLYIDAERALDPRLPVAYGVDKKMFILEDAPIPAEEHLSILESAVSSGEVGVVVVDSVTALTPRAILNGDYGDSTIGLQARLLSQSLAKLIHLIGETNTLLIFINQFREKITSYGDPKTTSGGHALPFYSTHRVEVGGSGKIKGDKILNDNGDVIGHKMKYKILKNKIGIPFRSGSIDLIYGKGFDTVGEVIDIAIDLGIITSAGSWFSYEGIDKVQGKPELKKAIASNEELMSEIKNKILEVLC